MLRTINSKFYGITLLLFISFGAGYLVLGYFLHQQEQSVLLARNTVELEKQISSLNLKFHEARLLDKELLSSHNTNALPDFNKSLGKIKTQLDQLQRIDFNSRSIILLKEIQKDINYYDSFFSKLLQLRTRRSLQETRMDTRYQSIASIVLDSEDPALFKPLFNISHFYIGYRTLREASRYRALLLAMDYFGRKAKIRAPHNIRLHDHLAGLKKLLETDYRTELQLITTEQEINDVTHELLTHFETISTSSETMIAERLQATVDIRDTLKLLFLISVAMGLLFLLLILRLFSKDIIAPIRQIMAVMQQISHGKMDARFESGGKRQDEIVKFGLSFNRMLDTLAANNQQLLVYQEELEQKVKELSRQKEEKEILADQLKRVEKMEALGTLAGGVAHDLNNILSGIVSYPDLLLLELPQKSPYRSKIELIQQSGRKAATIVDDLLTLARRGVQVVEVCNINSIINEYIKSPEFDKITSLHPQIHTELDLSPNLEHISGSPVHLMKTIMNLVVNGIEAIAHNGSVRLRTENRYVSHPIAGYDYVEEGEYAVLEVSDTGSGIQQEDLGKIFEPFYTKKSMGRSGTGLGLAVVWGTVKDHAGYIDVHSGPGQGTTFTLYFPATRKKPQHDKKSIELKEIRGTGEHLLVVDDSLHQREIAGEILAKLNYTVTKASSGEEAMKLVAANRYDLVLLDMIMPPGMDGLETYRQILEIYPEQRAIIISGYSETRRVTEARRIGASSYVKKPYSLQDIGLAIRAALPSDPHESGTASGIDPLPDSENFIPKEAETNLE